MSSTRAIRIREPLSCWLQPIDRGIQSMLDFTSGIGQLEAMANDDWPQDMMELRKQAVRKTIRRVSLEDLRKLGEARFPVVTDPWCERYFNFLNEHPDSRFYRAEVGADAEVVYCREPSKGMWFMPGFGMGYLRPRGEEALAEIVDSL